MAWAGDMAVSISLARSVGQIFALLFISPGPLTIEELCGALRISAGNASINLRTLEAWDAVERVWIKGSRRAHYKAVPDLKRIAIKRVEEGVRRRIELAREGLRRAAGGAPEVPPTLKGRLKEASAFLDALEKAVGLLPKLGSLAGWV